MSFDKNTTLQFILEYKRREVLWNPKDTFYYQGSKKEKAWEEISEIMHIDVNDLKKKMESLRGSYRREKSRLKFKLRTSETDYVPQWFAYEAMLFLDDRESKKLVTALTSKENIKAECDNDNTYLDIIDHKIEQEEASMGDPLSLETREINDQTLESGDNKRKRTDELKFEESYNFLEKDECIIFGEYISNKIKKLDVDLRALAQHKINNLLFELEMTQIRRSNSQLDVE